MPGHRESRARSRRPARLGAQLREARQRLNLSIRECATLLGIPHQTLASAETSADFSASILERAAQRMPGLRVQEVLQLPGSAVPAASRAAWEQYVALTGSRAGRVTIHSHALQAGLHRVKVSIEDARALPSTRGDINLLRRILCEMVCVGSPDVVRRVGNWSPGAHELREGDARHEWHLRDVATADLDYAFQSPSAAAPGTWEGGIAVDELVLVYRGRPADADRVRLLAWPFCSLTEPSFDIARRLYPIGIPMQRRGGTVTVRIPHPLPQVRYTLRLVSDQHVGAGPLRRSIGERLAARRAELGLGLGAVAKRSGLAPMACRLVETGQRVPRVSTVRALGTALGMTAEEVLGAADVESMLDIEQYYERVFGVVAAVVHKRLEIFPDGSSQSIIETRRLQTLQGETPTQMRLGVARAVLQRSPDLLEAIEGEVEDTTIKTIRREHAGCEYEFRFPERRRVGGINFVRRFARRPQFVLSAAEARSRFGTSDYASGTSLPCLHPAHVLRLEVLFPPGFEPSRIRGHCFPPGQVPRHTWPSLAVNASPRVAIGSTASGLVATLRIRAPLPGFQYAVGWTLPVERDDEGASGA